MCPTYNRIWILERSGRQDGLAALSRGLGLRRHRAGFFVLFTASWSSFSKAVSIAFSPGLPTHL